MQRLSNVCVGRASAWRRFEIERAKPMNWIFSAARLVALALPDSNASFPNRLMTYSGSRIDCWRTGNLAGRQQMTIRVGTLLGLGGAMLAGLLIWSAQSHAAAPACNTLPAPFPCGQGTHPVCSNRVQCYGGTGTVPQLTSVCTQTKCVKNAPSVPPQKPGATLKTKKLELNPQPEPPGRSK